MSALTERQMHDLAGRLTRLRSLAFEANEAATEEAAARHRRQWADCQFASQWAETVRQYGEKNAPPWNESLRGPKPKIETEKHDG
ncbi:hypothetical protein METUNv1_01731 [Methyloversatilis universalis FAM5]|uniref:Uncharacterized protein n=1 Tax=Methyloversatilis universalis (strain ATCC BAA-1314 / DSM 25237 / JCM 13912 / CCUG 52030 / FAM5) TaxID=1000565 RepID=F5RBT6_METUF|nr:hypothetical protein [Methyloversatilis universalis]EGK71953.1 hypothetical protein METUNv1_01731 [Methyloversatilis universalis FAM5]